MKHFINEELGAANVLKVAVDPEIVREFLPLSTDIFRRPDFYSTCPAWHSDVRWISPNSAAGFAIFQLAFDRLGIAAHVKPYVDIERAVRLYSGFLVVRSSCTEPDFHTDWVHANNEAFTLITPVSANASGFGMLYKKLTGTIAEYDYKIGEALILGDHFIHSTKPGVSDDPVVLLSFTFGTDKMEHWDNILQTAGHQGKLIRQPDGAFLELEG
ncbi:MAG TPA: hypothetical protein VK485_11775 [Sphingomicrobium sp.]|nr:hypothetical protein [Sphingomicrobium sp.]